MQSGQLDTLFDVLERLPTTNAAGQTTDSWQVVGQFWGGVEPISASAFVNSGVQGANLVCQIIMRPTDFPVKAEHMIRDAYSLAIYDIEGILPVPIDNKNRLMCSIGKKVVT